MQKTDSMEQQSSVEGMTVKELEEYLSKKPRGLFESFSQHKISVIGLILGVLLICMSGSLWDLQREVVVLRAEVARLQAEKAGLKTELSGNSKQETKQPEPKLKYHHIQSGDNFSVISKRYYGTEKYASLLARINGIPEDAQLNLGQVIKVPNKPDE